MSNSTVLTDFLIHWTARVFVACYAIRLLIDASGGRGPASLRLGRWVWTTGCVIFVFHVLLAFQFLHGWSHEAAFEHVRKRTFELTGLDSGVGVYINYLFGVVWLTDSWFWWRQLDWPEQRLPYWIVQAIFAFLMIQATIVFGPRYWVPIGVAVALLALVLRRAASLDSAAN